MQTLSNETPNAETGNMNMKAKTSKANPKNLGYVGSKPGSKGASRDSDSWYTPSKYIEAARQTLGGISLDPFSSDYANKTVKAANVLTVEDDSLKTEWTVKERNKSVWMNPPYSRGLCALAVDRFVDQFKAGKFTKGVVLVNNATETKWFHKLMGNAQAVCFTDHRIAFESPDGKRVSGNTRGQAFFVFDSNASTARETVSKFKADFEQFGMIMEAA